MTSSLPHYTVNLSEIAVGGAPLDVPSSSYGAAIVDTGSDAVYLPEALFVALTNAIGEGSAFRDIIPEGPAWFTTSSLENCTILGRGRAELDAALPPLTLTFGSGPAVDVQAPATESYLTAVEGLAATTCWVPGIATIPNLPYRIIGTSFLRSRIAIFDRQNQHMGFALPRPCP